MLARTVRLALASLAPALWPAGAQAASLWMAVSTPTTHTISAIAFPRPSKLVFVTTAGEIFHMTPGFGFVGSTVTPPNTLGFTDIAMSDDGVFGVAVGRRGTIYHSTDSGLTWTVVATIEPDGGCPNPGAYGPLGDDLLSAQFADRSTVYVTGNNGDVLKSTDAGAHFLEVNKSFGGCVADPGGSTQRFTDTAWIDATHGSLLSSDVGHYYSTSDGMTTAALKASASDGSATPEALALDRNDPSHAWAVSRGSMSGSVFRFTTDGGNSWGSVRYDGSQVGLRDIATMGGTVIAVGDGGDIYTSADRTNFYRQVAAPPNVATNWRAVAMLDATHAVVGGADGGLLYSTRANQPPDTIPPRGTISGPSRLAPGERGTFVAHVTDNPGGSGVDPDSYVWSAPGHIGQAGATTSFAFAAPGAYVITLNFRDFAGNANTAYTTVRVSKPPPSGSSPKTTSSGGATVTIFEKVTVTGRDGRFVPLVVSTGDPRKLMVTILTSKRHHHVAVRQATLRKGVNTIDVALGNQVKPGRYLIAVGLLTLGGHPLGRPVVLAFTLV